MNPSANAGDMGSTPGPGRSHMLWGNEAPAQQPWRGSHSTPPVGEAAAMRNPGAGKHCNRSGALHCTGCQFGWFRCQYDPNQKFLLTPSWKSLPFLGLGPDLGSENCRWKQECARWLSLRWRAFHSRIPALNPAVPAPPGGGCGGGGGKGQDSLQARYVIRNLNPPVVDTYCWLLLTSSSFVGFQRLLPNQGLCSLLSELFLRWEMLSLRFASHESPSRAILWFLSFLRRLLPELSCPSRQSSGARSFQDGTSLTDFQIA